MKQHWTIGCTWLPKMYTESLAVIWPIRVIIQPAEYQDIAAQIITDSQPCFTVGPRHSVFLGRCPNVNPTQCWEQHEGWLTWPYYVFAIIRCPGFMIIAPSFSSFSVDSSNQRFSNRNSSMDVDLWSSCRLFLGSRVFGKDMGSAVTFAVTVLWFLDTILFNVQRSVSLSFGFRPLFLLADDVFPWFVYAIITFGTAALETPNNVAVLVTDAPSKRAPMVCPLWKSDKSPIL